MMPLIDLDTLKTKLTPAQFTLVKGIVATRGENKGRLRASKPKVAKKIKVAGTRWENDYYYDFANEADALTGMTAYVWRMVAFYASPKSQHNCMPVCADFDLPGTVKETRETAKKLDTMIVNVVLDTIPQLHGLNRWAQVYGLAGTPQYNKEGAVIYR